MKRAVGIIGAGLAGLSAGIYARLNGYPCRIFEHHGKPGGVVAAWRRGDYLFDGGIHFLMGHKRGQATHDLYSELGIIEHNPVIELDPYLVFQDMESGRELHVTSDLDRFARDMTSLSPGHENIFLDLVAMVKSLAGVDLMMGVARPPELSTLKDKIANLWNSRKVMKLFMGKYGRSLRQFSSGFSDPWAREVFNNLFLPEVPVWFVIMLLRAVADGQLGLLQKGSLHLARGLESRFIELGGEISYRSTVEKILVENGRASGVRLADGSEHRFDVVVSAADGYSTIFEMLDGRYVDGRIRRRYSEWGLFRPMFMANFGVAMEFAGAAPVRMVRLSRPVKAGGEAAFWMSVRTFNYGDFSPPGKTAVQAVVETEWDYWSRAREDRDFYKSEKERMADELLARLDELHPGLAARVEVTDTASPYTTWRYTRNHRGAFEGFLPTPRAIMTRVDKTLPGLADFFMIGQWVMPGGGVPPCLYSGRHLAEILCAQDGSGFRTRV